MREWILVWSIILNEEPILKHDFRTIIKEEMAKKITKMDKCGNFLIL